MPYISPESMENHIIMNHQQTCASWFSSATIPKWCTITWFGGASPNNWSSEFYSPQPSTQSFDPKHHKIHENHMLLSWLLYIYISILYHVSGSNPHKLAKITEIIHKPSPKKYDHCLKSLKIHLHHLKSNGKSWNPTQNHDPHYNPGKVTYGTWPI